jgi:hypothetical protein
MKRIIEFFSAAFGFNSPQNTKAQHFFSGASRGIEVTPMTSASKFEPIPEDDDRRATGGEGDTGTGEN